MAQMLDLSEVPMLLAPGHRVFVAGSCSEPQAMLAAIAVQPACAEGVTFVQQPLPINQYDLSSFHNTTRQETYFVTPSLKDGLATGRVLFTPMQMRNIFDHIARMPVDVALLSAARDQHGVIRYAANVDYLDAARAAAKMLVVEVSDAYTAPFTCPAVDENEVDYLVTCESPVMTYPATEPDETSSIIGAHIAGLIRDGDCLQTGIGAVPAAILAKLKDKNDLGFHGGLIDDGVMELIDAGNINGRQKRVDTGRHVTGMALGSESLHEWLVTNESVLFRSANYTHDYHVIAQIPRFVSINSAVEIDLFGQVNAEVAGGRQISGTGGSVDFMRASKASKGGRSVVAMASTARGGSVSRIVPTVEMVTALRTDVDIVVTEFGVAELFDAPLQERAERLIAIAHPDFQDQLRYGE
ncbi:MAG: acetyl-CoA hydrolase/transferase C-terminal domain-containing protein [Pseudomonadota bacterium]|nr:acetyl-CoA hydrolase/transferase C-terminal domain-containing protein [Pseudomonadota bacterium]